MGKLLIIFFYFIIFNVSFASLIDFKKSILPTNQMSVGIEEKSNGMNSKTFSSLIKRVSDGYRSEFPLIGGRLVVKKSWRNKTVNAYALKKGKKYIIHFYGGMARHPLITSDGFALVVCHEIGHHLGGAPLISSAPRGWKVSVEGQADYFSTGKCFRRVFESDDNSSIIKKMTVPKIVTEKCSSVYHSENEIALCQRAAMAGKSLSNLFQSHQNPEVELKFSTPDQHVVFRTWFLHPKAQCRLDTYFQSILCDRDVLIQPSFTDYEVGYCTQNRGDELGLRPRCWFAP